MKKLEIYAKKKTSNLFAGSFDSLFKGRGLEFEEIREYKPGDDVRAIDWKATSRLKKPFIKEYKEERNLNIWFLVDVSGSMFFGRKKELAEKIIALIGYAGVLKNDLLGMILFSESIDGVMRLKSGKKHYLALLDKLDKEHAKLRSTNLREVFKKAKGIIKTRSLIFVISDFFQPIDFEKELIALSKKHEVIGIVVRERMEEGIEGIEGSIAVHDAETGSVMLLEGKELDAYAKQVKEHDALLHDVFKKAAADLLKIYVDEDPFYELVRFFKTRRR